MTSKKEKKHFATREDEVKRKAEELRALIGKIEAVRQKIEKAGNVSQKEEDLRNKISTSDSIITQAQEQNAQFRAKEGFDPTNTSYFDEYNHQKDLLKTANNLLSNKSYKKTNANAGFAREIIEIAKKTIEEEAQRLFNMDEVQYFINLATIKSETEKREGFRARFDEISTQKKEIDALQAQISNLCKGKTPEEIRKEYEEASKEKQTIDEIHQITTQRQRLEHLTAIVRKNNEILEQLAQYQTLTNAQYRNLIDFIDLDDIY